VAEPRTGARFGLLALLALPAALATGCSDAASAPDVASLPVSAPAAVSAGMATTGASPQVAGRPQFRLDDSEVRRTALINAYSTCLLHHGAKPLTGRSQPAAASGSGDGTAATALIQVADPVPAHAKAACLHLLPQMPPEVEASTNPHFHEQSLAYVDCLRSHGLWVRLLDDHDLDWTYLAGHPVPAKSDQIEHNCLLTAFGGDR